MRRTLALLLALAVAAPAPAQLLPPLPGGSLIVTLTSPSQGATVSGTVTVGANVSIVGTLTVARVDFYVDNALIGSDSTAPYAVSWDTRKVGNGSHTLTAVAQDVLGARWASSGVSVTVANDITRPTVTIIQAAGQADPTSASPLNFTAVFSEPVSGFTGSDVTIGGTAGGTKSVGVSGGPSTYSVAVSGMTSSGTVTATIAAGVASDAAGNTNTASTSTDNTVTFNLPDTTAPTVSITSPANGATVSGTINVTASASDNVSVAGVQFQLDGVARADDTSAPYSISWDTTTAADDTHTISAVARDAAGNTRTSATITVTVSNAPPPDTTAPMVSIASPANGATVSGTINVTASASDNVGVTSVQFRLDGADAGPADTSAPYSIAWNTTTAADGAHTISAVARDAAGNQTASAPVTVTVANGGSPATTRFEEDHAAVGAAPAGAWRRVGPEVAAFSGGTAGASNASGATATFTFSGTAVSWLGLKCNACGIATVSLDGAAPMAVDTAGPGAPDGSLVSEAVFSASGLDPAASHTLVITVTGNSNSGGAYVVVDAFDVAGASGGAATRTEETGPGVSAAGAWALRGAETAAFSGGSAGSSNAAGSSVTLDFTGTAVSWIGLKCSACGIATVSIDGGEANAVDTAGPAAPGSPGLASGPVFSASGLAAGSHRLAITVTGTTSTGGAHVVVDAFDVTP
jgi:hypothetical protein